MKLPMNEKIASLFNVQNSLYSIDMMEESLIAVVKEEAQQARSRAKTTSMKDMLEGKQRPRMFDKRSE